MTRPTNKSRKAKQAAAKSRLNRVRTKIEEFVDSLMNDAEGGQDDRNGPMQLDTPANLQAQSPDEEISLESDDDIYLTDREDEAPTGEQWEGILRAMTPEVQPAIKYSRGPSENRVTKWRHSKEKERFEKSAKSSARITTFFQVRVP